MTGRYGQLISTTTQVLRIAAAHAAEKQSRRVVEIEYCGFVMRTTARRQHFTVVDRDTRREWCEGYRNEAAARSAIDRCIEVRELCKEEE